MRVSSIRSLLLGNHNFNKIQCKHTMYQCFTFRFECVWLGCVGVYTHSLWACVRCCRYIQSSITWASQQSQRTTTKTLQRIERSHEKNCSNRLFTSQRLCKRSCSTLSMPHIELSNRVICWRNPWKLVAKNVFFSLKFSKDKSQFVCFWKLSIFCQRKDIFL